MMERKIKYIQSNSRCPSLLPPDGCRKIYPGDRINPVDILPVDTCIYCALSDGKRRVYTNEDGLRGYSQCGILNPLCVSYYNLFINGVLQPPVLYDVEEGLLILKSSDIPPEGAPVLLQFITIRSTDNC